jgi:hypothetical protein
MQIFDFAALRSSKSKITAGTSPTATLRGGAHRAARSAIVAIAARLARMTDT